MPRKLRIEYPGATDPIISRGNYRKDLFSRRGSGEEGYPGKRDELLKRCCRGWFTGSVKAKKELAKDLADKTPGADGETADLRDLNEARWGPWCRLK